MKVIDAFAAWLDMRAAELRTGTTLVEAVAIDERLTELRMIGDPEELLRIAIAAGKAGLRESDIEPMALSYYSAQNRFQRLAYQAEEYAADFRPRS